MYLMPDERKEMSPKFLAIQERVRSSWKNSVGITLALGKPTPGERLALMKDDWYLIAASHLLTGEIEWLALIRTIESAHQALTEWIVASRLIHDSSAGTDDSCTLRNHEMFLLPLTLNATEPLIVSTWTGWDKNRLAGWLAGWLDGGWRESRAWELDGELRSFGAGLLASWMGSLGASRGEGRWRRAED